MPALQYSAAEFASALQALMPRGKAWPRDPASVQSKVLTAMAQSYARNTSRAAQLLVDAFPLTTVELLPEWESTLGLPDPCAGLSPTLAARRAQVVARLKAQGGQSIAYFVAFALALGYVVTVTQFVPARAGLMRAGRPLCGPAWAHAWQINTVLNTVQRARAGSVTAGEPLAYWSNAVLECELNAVKPAHTVLIFSYT